MSLKCLMYRRRADLEIARRPNTEEAQQSVQSQRQNHNHATPTDAVSCNFNRNYDFLRCMISFIKYMLVMSNALPFHQVICYKLLCNANWLKYETSSTAVDATWATWGSWGSCNVTCGGGVGSLQSSTTLNSIFHSDTRSIKRLQLSSKWRKHSDMYKCRHRITILQHQRMP